MSLRVLVPTDLSPDSGYALDWVRRRLPAADIRLLHVVDDFALYLHATPMSPVVRLEPQIIELEVSERDAEARRTLAGWALPGLETWEVRHGDPAEVIAQAASDWGADLIALGTHGRGWLGQLLHPSVTRRVMRESLVPVLALPVPRRPVSVSTADARDVARPRPGGIAPGPHLTSPPLSLNRPGAT